MRGAAPVGPTSVLPAPRNSLGVVMKTRFDPRRGVAGLLLVSALVGLTACSAPRVAAPSVTLTESQPNVVSYWNDIANKTVLATSTVNTAPEEQRPAVF